MGRVM